MRYIGKTFRGKSGEFLYPADADLMYKIDQILERNNEFAGAYSNFSNPVWPAYKNKDVHFVSYISKSYPEYLQKLEDRLSKSEGPYLLGKHMTIADCSTGAIFFKTSHNDNYEHNLILKVMINKYPKVTVYLNKLSEDFKDLVASNKFTF